MGTVNPVFLAMAIGILGGMVVAAWIAVRIYDNAIRRAKDWSYRRLNIAKLIGGTVIAAFVIPALFLAFVVGGNLGGATAASLGTGAVGVAIGLGFGLAAVFVATTTFAILLSLFLAVGISRLAT